MPQKRNPDVPELVRGKAATAIGDLTSLLSLVKALPLGYNVTLVADAHSTTDGALRAEQVIAHHNRTLRWMTSYGPRMEVKPAAEVAFDA